MGCCVGSSGRAQAALRGAWLILDGVVRDSSSVVAAAPARSGRELRAAGEIWQQMGTVPINDKWPPAGPQLVTQC